MIRTKKDLEFYLDEDKKRSPNRYKHLFFKWLTRSDEYYNIAFMKTLRHYEYYLNKKEVSSICFLTFGIGGIIED